MKKLNTDESKSQADSDVSAKYDTHSSNDEYVPEPVKTKPEPDRQIKIMTKSLLSLAKTCDWTGVSDRSAAVLATSVHHDLGLVSPIDQSKVIDRSKIRRERRENRKELLQNGDQFDHSGIEGIFFDVRKDQTLTKEPGSSYFSHTTPQSGSSKDITKSLVASLKEVNAKTQNIKVVGCDGTNMNTGHTVGVIRRLEESFEHPLHWLVCLLHANELSLIFQSSTTQRRSRQQHGYCIGVSRRSTQATAGKGLAQGPYVAARAGVEPTTLLLKVIISTKAPSRPTTRA